MATQKTVRSDVARTITAQDLALNAENKRVGNPEQFSSYIRAMAQNWRQGTVASKDRGEVAFSGKKPWKQKGTGQARAGTRRSPLWRKGGTIFGPQERVRTLKVSRRSKQGVMNSLFWQVLELKKVVALDWVPQGDRPKTAHAYAMLKEAGLHQKRVVLFVAPHDYQLHASFNNIANVRMLLFDQPNACALAAGEYWTFLSRDMESFKTMVSAWI